MSETARKAVELVAGLLLVLLQWQAHGNPRGIDYRSVVTAVAFHFLVCGCLVFL